MIGGRCPPGLVSASSEDGPADLVVVAPTREECRAPGWLQRAARTAARALAEDGVAFALAPHPWRLRLLWALRREGLALGPTVLHLPELASSRYLVPADGPAARYATACLVPRSSWRGRAASLAARVPGGARLVAQADLASLVARRPAAAPLFRWLSETAGVEAIPAESVAVVRTWRRAGGSSTVFVLDARADRPRLVARVGSGPAAARRSLGEHGALATFAASAEEAGAVVPRPVASSQFHGVPVVVATGVPGRVASSALAERPHRAPEVLDRVLAWLLRWNRATATEATLTPELLADEVLAAARLVAPALASGDAYIGWLDRRCGDLAGTPTTLTAAHDDLTATNVLLGRAGIGIVDWDTARANALPLVDFFYTVVDAYAALERYADRPRAFADCFSAGGGHREAVRARQEPFERALGLTPGVVAVAFHACWLHHAANEVARGDERGAFVEIVRQLAADPERFAP